jgi:putative ABC transport system permease protein
MLSDIRVAARVLRARPLFSFVAIATLAVGIGSNAAIFSVIDAVLLRPLPYSHSERLVAVYSRYLPSTGYEFSFFPLSGPEFFDLRSRTDAFSAIAAYDTAFQNLALNGTEPERVLTMRVTAGFFEVLGVPPQQGRPFRDDETQRSDGCVAVLAHDVSARAFARGTDPLGSTIRLDDALCQIVGVMPDGFGFGDSRVKIWTGLLINSEETPANRASHSLMAIARLREGVRTEQADAQLQSLRGYWSEQYPDHYAKGHFAVLRPLHEDVVGDQRQGLVVLCAAVVCLLLIVCVNLAALLVSHSEARRRDFAVRRALGAGRGRLLRQLLSEAMVLSVLGGALGLLLGHWLLAALLTLYPERLPTGQTIAIDMRAIVVTTAVTIVSGFVLGLVPALHATGRDLHQTLRIDARTATSSRRGVVARSVLVVSQLALSLVLLVGAVLLLRSYQYLQRVELGFDPDQVLTFTVSVPTRRQPDPATARRMIQTIEERLASLPGADTAAAVSSLPLVSAGPPDDFVIDGRAAPGAGSPSWNARYIMATPRLFAALRIPLKRGRLLGASDAASRPLVAVINETAARLYWPNEDPVGKNLRYYPRETSPSIQIVGIVGDVRSMGANVAAPAAIYVPYDQAPRPAYQGRSMTFVVRAHGNPNDLVASARSVVAAIDAGLPLASVRPLTVVVSEAMGPARFTTLVMSFFAGVAFFLAALGLYGILAYAVEQRGREIGIRIALGARPREIFRLIVGNAMSLTAIAIIVGVGAALALTRLMSGLLSGVTSTDRTTYAAVIVLLSAAALLASYIPARRAIRADPLLALRAE